VTGKPLEGIRVIDLTRLAPGPYCTMLLADMGAEVIVVGGGPGSLPIPVLCRGKRFISLDLKTASGKKAFHRLVQSADILIEGYRPGVMERLEAGYETLRALNPRLVYCSLTGYGRGGPLEQEAGHDLNYLAVSGALGAFGPSGGVPAFPLNLLADFAGGSLFAALGIMVALYARQSSGQGQYVDAAMVDGCMSMMAMHFADWGRPVLAGRGDGLVAGNAPFYRCYRCADDRFIAVGALERRFFENLWRALGYAEPPPPHMDRAAWPAMTARFEQTFAARARDAWSEIFAGKDACVTPVLDPDEALEHPQNRLRHPEASRGNAVVAPLLSGTSPQPGAIDLTDRTLEILRDLGLSADEAEAARAPQGNVAGLAWPPL
jgi:alpha-methylacyl-CoA racemase